MQKEGSVLSILHGSTSGGAFAKLAVLIVALVAMIATSLALTVGTAAAEEGEYVPEDVDAIEVGDDSVMGASLGGFLDTSLIGIRLEYNANGDQLSSSRKAVKYVVDVLDQAGNAVALPAGSVVPAKIDLDSQATVNAALASISIPGATYDYSYMWWGGAYKGTVSTLNNFAYYSSTGYNSYIGYMSTDRWGTDYWTNPGWIAYSRTGTLHIVYRLSVTPTLSVTDYYGAYDSLAHTGLVTVSAGVAEYSTDGENWATTAPTICDAGSATYYVRANYGGVCSEAQTLTLTVVPRNATVTVIGNQVNAVYDGYPHTAAGYDVTEIAVEQIEGVPTPVYSADSVVYSGRELSVTLTDAGEFYMGLPMEQAFNNVFTNSNPNFNVTFNVIDGYIRVEARDVTVSVSGNWETYIYDGTEHSVSGWMIEDIDVEEVEGQPTPYFSQDNVEYNAYYGTDVAKGTNVGKYWTSLSGSDFSCDNSNFYVTFEVEDGCLTIVERGVYVSIAGNTRTTAYDGTEQMVTGWSVTSYEVAPVEGQALPEFDPSTMACDPAIAVASGTAVGTYQMGFDSGNFYTEDTNYTAIVTYTDGYLLIEPRDVTVNVAGNSLTTTYDGTEQMVTGWGVTSYNVAPVEGLATPEFDESTVKFGSVAAFARGTNAGEYVMGLTPEEFWCEDTNFNVTINCTDGFLNITPRAVTVNIAGNSLGFVYDGTEHMVTGWDITSYEVAPIEGKATPDFDTSSIKFYSVAAVAKGTDAGTYPMGISAQEFWCEDDNFTATINWTDGVLTIQPRAVTVNVAGVDWTISYDGAKHMVAGWDVKSYEVAPIEGQETPEFDKSTVKLGATVAYAEGTDAGTYPMGLTERDFFCEDENFTATFVVTDGYLQIDPRDVAVRVEGNIVVTTYNGKEQVAEGWAVTDVKIAEVEGQAAPEDFDAASVKSHSLVAVAKGTDAGTYPMDLSSDEFYYEDPNYNVTFVAVDGGLKINPLDGVVVTIKGNTAEYPYDGKAHKVEGYTATYSSTVFTDKDFYMTGTASVSATEAGTYAMGLKADQFSVASKNFSNVKFVVTDGQLVITGESIPKTGDDTNTALPMAAGVAGACAIAAGAMMLVRRQREN